MFASDGHTQYLNRSKTNYDVFGSSSFGIDCTSRVSVKKITWNNSRVRVLRTSKFSGNSLLAEHLYCRYVRTSAARVVSNLQAIYAAAWLF